MDIVLTTFSKLEKVVNITHLEAFRMRCIKNA